MLCLLFIVLAHVVIAGPDSPIALPVQQQQTAHFLEEARNRNTIMHGSISSFRTTPASEFSTSYCSSNGNSECLSLLADCLNCTFNHSCVYGDDVQVSCQPKQGVVCTGEREFKKTMNCRYCYQTDPSSYDCQCKVGTPQPQQYIANCTMHSNVLCMGHRQFQKSIQCNWTAGYRWSTALLLSICLGGFGADRFYLGHWQEGIGKLFSFGGLGVWTLVDVILVATGYLGPADRSLYL